MESALWAGDVEALHRLAPCHCCCAEHTHESCLARAWFGCRGQGAFTEADQKSWERVYAARGMTREEFHS